MNNISNVEKAKRNIHNNIVYDLERRLKKGNYTTILKFQEYGKYHRPIGEIDLLGIKNNYVVLFEMKSTNSQRNYVKAVRQLKRAKLKYNGSRGKRVFMFYVTPNKIQWLKQ